MLKASKYLSMHRDRQASSEPDSDVPGFVTHFWKHFSLHLFISCCAFSNAISFLTDAMKASLFRCISGADEAVDAPREVPRKDMVGSRERFERSCWQVAVRETEEHR